MRLARTRTLVVAALVLLLLQAGPALAKKKKDKAEEKKKGLVVSQWLVLGPAADALPVFHEAEKGGFELEDLLEAARFPTAPWYPAAGGAETWFGGESLTWRAAEAGKDGSVFLEAGETSGYAVAWLAAYISTDRWREVKVELTGTQPRRFWVDGKAVASGGLSKNDDKPVEGSVKLTRGKHLLLVRTVLDPEREADWTVGGALRPAEEGGWPEGAEAGAVLGTDPERDVTILDILDPPEVRSMALSPDGTLAALGFRRTLPGSDKTESWIEVRDTSTGETTWTWRGSKGMGDVDWAPGGRRLSFTSTNGDGKKTTLWLADLDESSVKPLIEGVKRWGGYTWSPTGDTVVFSTSVEPKKDETGVKRLESIQDRWSYHRTKSFLHALAVPGGAHRRITAGGDDTYLSSISPDGKKILFTRYIEDVAARPYSRTELWEMDLESLEAEKLRDFRFGGDAEYSPDGTRLLVTAGPSAFDGAGLAVSEGTIPNDYDNQLYLWNPDTDEVEAITREFDPSVEGASWSHADGSIYIRGEDRDYGRLYRYDVEAGTFEELNAGPEVVRSFALARSSAGVVLARGSSVWHPPFVTLVDPEANTHRLFEYPGKEWFAGVRRGTVEPWTFTASSGKTIDGRYYLPPDFDPEKKYPCIVYYYGGTSPVHRGFGGRYPKEYWASMGYVVYVVNPSGATGYGQEFSSVHVNDWGKTTSAEIIEGAKKFAEAHSFVDGERLGCIGASYGGFMTMTLVTRTDLFAAAVSHAGISDLSSYWGEGYWGYSYSSVATAESFPWNRRDVYVDQSPLFHADKVTTPILLTHGADDTNVPRGESDQFFIALKLLGAPVEYIRVAGQDHWIIDHDKRVLWSNSIVAWFDRWLKDQPEWWNEVYPE